MTVVQSCAAVSPTRFAPGKGLAGFSPGMDGFLMIEVGALTK